MPCTCAYSYMCGKKGKHTVEGLARAQASEEHAYTKHMRVCFKEEKKKREGGKKNKKSASPSHTPALSPSVTDVYMLISNCASTCARQTFFFFCFLQRIRSHMSAIRHNITCMSMQRRIFSLTPPQQSHLSKAPKHVGQLIASCCLVTWNDIAAVQGTS